MSGLRNFFSFSARFHSRSTRYVGVAPIDTNRYAPICETKPNSNDITGLSNVQSDDEIYVAMSGGVDSSTVAALSCHRYGPTKIKGVFMNNWSSVSKCQESSWRDVQKICDSLKIDRQRIDLEHDYWTDVFEPMLQAYQNGDTPNPDVSCNRYIKFGTLLSSIRERDPQMKWLATGHYAGLSFTDSTSNCFVRRPTYLQKDQSYYLATVSSTTLNNVLFPLAQSTKPEVRKLASSFGLTEVAEKPDSQGLCFVEQQEEFGSRGFNKFLSEYSTDNPGPIVTANNLEKIVGQHSGLWTHTIGQRVSLAMPQASPETRGKWFVVGKDKMRNALIIDRGSNAPSLFSNQVISKDFHWHRKPQANGELAAQYRSLQKPWFVSNWTEPAPNESVMTFADSRRAVSPGQYLVVYENDIVIGAGTIDHACVTS